MQQNHRFAIGAEVRRSDVGIHANRRFAAHVLGSPDYESVTLRSLRYVLQQADAV